MPDQADCRRGFACAQKNNEIHAKNLFMTIHKQILSAVCALPVRACAWLRLARVAGSRPHAVWSSFSVCRRCLCLISVGVSLLASGCTTLFGSQVELDELRFEVDAGANSNTPFSVELVLVRDPELLKTLLTVSARQWFAQRNQWLSDHPDALETWYYELVPGQRLSFEPTAFGGDSGEALLLYSDYASSNVNRVRLERYSFARVVFGNKDVRVLGER